MNENRLDNMRVVPIEEITPEELVTMKYSIETDCIQCPKCKYIFDGDMVEEWGVDENDYDEMDYDDFDDLTDDGVNKITCPNCNHTDYANKFRTVWTDDIIDAPNCEDLVPGIKKAYDELDENKKVVNNNMNNNEQKANKTMNLTEATIKALYDGLKDDTEIKDIEGLVDDVLVVTDPEITTDEYNEVIDRACEILEDTPEGDLPLDPKYLGEYAQLCPICGGSFIDDHILEPGTACPICYETPEAFIMLGQLQSDDSVAEDNGIEDSISDKTDNMEDTLGTDTLPVDELGNDTEEKPDEQESEGTTAEPMSDETNTETPTRVRGARQRRERDVASKEIPQGNILVETRINQALLKDRETNKSYTYKELQDMYNTKLDSDNLNGNEYTFDKYISDLITSGDYMDLKESCDKQDLSEENSSVEQEFTKEFADEATVRELAANSALTWEGMATSDDNLQAIVDDFKENTNIKLPVHFYIFSGKLMNEMYGLTQNNAYPDDLNFVAVDLDNWASMRKLPMYRLSIGARWLDDIVDNNRVRQNNIDGIDDED